MRTATPGRIDVAFSGKRARFPLTRSSAYRPKAWPGFLDRQVAARPRWRAASQGLSGRRPVLRPIGYVFKESSLFPHLSVRRNLLYAARKRKPRPIGFDEVLELLPIAPLLDRSPAHLSSGERQCVANGRALLSQPRVLLMDEPLATLDRCAKRAILPCLKRLNETLAVPMIYFSHDMAEIEHLSDHLVMMERGTIIATEPLHILQSDPKLPLAASREAAVSVDAAVGGYDGRYRLLMLRLKGARLLVPAPPLAPGVHERLRIARQRRECHA